MIKWIIKAYIWHLIIGLVCLAILLALRETSSKDEGNNHAEGIEEILKDSVLIDTRDDNQYRIRRFGNLWWMIDNLNYQSAGELCYREAYVGLESYCYDNNESNTQQYGRLYDLPAALKACPNGWRLPTREEWQKLDKQYAGCKWDAASETGNYRDTLPSYEPVGG